MEACIVCFVLLVALEEVLVGWARHCEFVEKLASVEFLARTRKKTFRLF